MFFTRVPVNCLKKYGQVNRSACLESGRQNWLDEKEHSSYLFLILRSPSLWMMKHQKLKDAMEKLDARFGKGTVIKASLMKKEPNTKEKDEKRR